MYMELINLDERERENNLLKKIWDLYIYMLESCLLKNLDKILKKIFLPIFLFFDYYEIQSNHFQKLIEVLVIYVFQILHIVLIFVSRIREI